MRRTTSLLVVTVFSIVGFSITGCASPTYETHTTAARVPVIRIAASADEEAATDPPPVATPAATAAATPTDARRDAVIREGALHLKAPYVFGATTNTATKFDCSSFVKYLFAKEGISLPRTAWKQSQSTSLGHTVSLSNLEKGDVIFFKTTSSRDIPIDHVGVYAGDGRILHTYRVGVGVTYSSFAAGTFWRNHAVLARDFLH